MRARLRGVIVQLAAALWILCPSSAVAADRQQPLPIEVLVFNYSAASSSTLRNAVREAKRIFSDAGLLMRWHQCPVPLTSESDAACAAGTEPRSIQIRVVTHPDRNYVADSVFGITLTPTMATVYYGSALRLAKIDNSDYETSVILGCVIVHEIGHLLLGPGAHTRNGIMQAKWRRDQLDQAMKGRLLFTAAQAERLRVQATTRPDK